MKKLILLVFLTTIIAVNFTANAQKESQKEFDIATMINCKVCEESINEALNSIEGVEYFALDFKTQSVNIKYNSIIISEKEIKNSILDIGLPVDGVDGDEDAYKELPDCCKKATDQKGKRTEEILPENSIEETEIIIEKKEKKKKNKKSEAGGDSAWD